jgi:hypothetical protein
MEIKPKLFFRIYLIFGALKIENPLFDGIS